MRLVFLLIAVLAYGTSSAQNDSSYADKLGFPRGAKVIILHVDDAGMSSIPTRAQSKRSQKVLLLL